MTIPLQLLDDGTELNLRSHHCSRGSYIRTGSAPMKSAYPGLEARCGTACADWMAVSSIFMVGDATSIATMEELIAHLRDQTAIKEHKNRKLVSELLAARFETTKLKQELAEAKEKIRQLQGKNPPQPAARSTSSRC